MYDYHAHTIYSDGGHLDRMIDAAADAGFEGIGFADHCSVTVLDHRERVRARYDRNFDLTYERRRAAIERLRKNTPIRVFDAVEVDYEPSGEDRIERFLADAGFDYTLGSVHYVGDRTVFWESFENEADRRAFVDDYYDAVVSLIESELFDVVAHVDIVESRPELAGLTTREHADRVADALADSRTVPEINAGRSTRPDKPADFHPTSPVIDAIRDRGVAVTVGTDSHDPDHVAPRGAALRDRVAELGVDPVAPG